MDETSAMRVLRSASQPQQSPAPLPPKYCSPVHPHTSAAPGFVRASGNFKLPSNDALGRNVLLERDHNQAQAANVLWHGASSKFTSAMADRFYTDNSLDKARKLKETPPEAKVEKTRQTRLSRILQQKEELDSIRARQKTMKSRIKQFIEERLELEQKFTSSAIVIQRHVRGFLARKRVALWMYEREKQRLQDLLGIMQKQINCFWTGSGEQANHSATKIQALYRGFRVRIARKRQQQDALAQAQAEQKRRNAAVLIQREYRKFMAERQARQAALEAIRKRLLVLKLKYFWHRKKFFWAAMRKKYQVAPAVQQPEPVQPPKRPVSAKRTGGGFVTENPRPRVLSIESAPPPPTEPTPVAQVIEAKKPQVEARRPTVPLIPRPRPPRPPKTEEEHVQQAPPEPPKRTVSRSFSDSPPKYLQPTTSFKYRTGVDASVDMPSSKGRKRYKKMHDSALTRPTASRLQYVQESKEERARSADARERLARQWKPTVGGATAETKALPALERLPPKLPSYCTTEEEETKLKPHGLAESVKVSETAIQPLAEIEEKPRIYRPPVKQSLDFKEALPEYHDFLEKYGKNVRQSTPRLDVKSSASFRSSADQLRITPRVSAKKVEL